MINSHDKGFTRIYTIHSQKGGVGKTSLALAIAGFAAIHHNKKTLIIDADLTGTSLADVFNVSDLDQSQYINELLLAKPSKFGEYTPITSIDSEDLKNSLISQFYQNIQGFDDLFYAPGSPCFVDILKIIPLITQEDRLNFFRQRFEDIIVTAIMNDFEVIIIDLPPGLFGISTSLLHMIIDHVSSQIETEKDRKVSRLNKILRIAMEGKSNAALEAHTIFITTSDRADYRALFPSLSSMLEQNMQLVEKDNQMWGMDIFLNKTDLASDPVFEFDKIFKDILTLPKQRRVHRHVVDYLRRRIAKKGALSCQYASDFNIDNILLTIQRLKNIKDIDGEKQGIEKWCYEIGHHINLLSMSDSDTIWRN